MEPRRRNPLRRSPTAVCISVLHFGLTQPTRALNGPEPNPARASQAVRDGGGCNQSGHGRSTAPNLWVPYFWNTGLEPPG